MAKAIVNLDDIKATRVGRIYNVKNTVEMENGSLVKIGSLATGEREIFEAAAVTDATADKVALVASDEVNYDPRKSTWADFTNEANAISKAYELVEEDVYTISEDGYTGDAVVGQYLITSDADLKAEVAADLTGGTVFAAEIIALTTLGFDGIPAARVRVIKNG